MHPCLRLAAPLAGFLLILAITGPVYAQVNTERFRAQAGEEGFKGSLELSFSNRTGNTDLMAGGLALGLGWKREADTVLLIGDANVGKKRTDTTINKGFLHLRGHRELTPVAAAEVFTQYEYDKFSLLDLRFLVGAGPRFRVLHREAVTVHLGIAYMLEREQLNLAPGAPENPSPTSHRLSTHLALKVALAPHLTLTNTVYLQPRLDDPDDTRVLEDLGLKVGLGGPLSLRIGFTLRYDGDPPTTVKGIDSALSNRLVWDF